MSCYGHLSKIPLSFMDLHIRRNERSQRGGSEIIQLVVRKARTGFELLQTESTSSSNIRGSARLFNPRLSPCSVKQKHLLNIHLLGTESRAIQTQSRPCLFTDSFPIPSRCLADIIPVKPAPQLTNLPHLHSSLLSSHYEVGHLKIARALANRPSLHRHHSL